MGGHEVHADYKKQLWVVHDHFAVGGCTEDQLEKLRKGFFEPRNGWEGLMQIDAVTNAPRQLAYTAKFTSFRYGFKQTGPKRSKGFRLHRDEHNEHMRYLARHAPMDLVFVIGAGRNNGRHYELNPDCRFR